MMGTMRLVFLLACLAGSSWANCQVPPVSNPSLGSVLELHHVPTNQFSPRELKTPITSWAVSKDDEPFLFAWYDDDGSGLLSEPLHVMRYTKEHGLKRTDIRGNADKFELSGFTKSTPHMCLGSALGVVEESHRILVDTHINPSAGCVLVLRDDLSFQAAVSGWVLGTIDGNLVIHEGEIHFAPTHQGKLGVFDVIRNQWTELYPMRSDPARAAFAAKVKTHMPTEERRREANIACDPSEFDVEMTNLTVDAVTHAFQFDVSFSAQPFGDQTADAVDDEIHAYACRLHGSSWKCALIR